MIISLFPCVDCLSWVLFFPTKHSDSTFNCVSLSSHSLIFLKVVFHGTQEKVSSGLQFTADVSTLTVAELLNVLLMLLNPVFYYYADKEVTWRSDGCKTVNIIAEETECHCNHLTYFAILVVSSKFTKTTKQLHAQYEYTTHIVQSRVFLCLEPVFSPFLYLQLSPRQKCFLYECYSVLIFILSLKCQ